MKFNYNLQLLRCYLNGIYNNIDFSGYSENDLIEFCKKNGIKYNIFKIDKIPLKRVSWVINKLKGLYPQTLLDIGTGRGVFLMQLLSADILNHLRITCIDINFKSIKMIEALKKGGIKRLNGVVMNAENMGFKDKSFDVITALEVIEHIHNTEKVFLEMFRVAKKYIILSVPSKEDNNPTHIHYFDNKKLNNYILKFQPDKNKIETIFVRGHLIKVIKI